jgi:hypothetical protein
MDFRACSTKLTSLLLASGTRMAAGLSLKVKLVFSALVSLLARPSGSI